MKITDISMTIHSRMAVYKGRQENLPVHTVEKEMLKDSINESSIRMNLHTGTHMDSPKHMMQAGWTMDEMPLFKLITRCTVFDLTGVEDAVTQSDLEHFDIRKGDFILLKTQNSFGLVSGPDFIYIRKDAAEYLAQKEIKGIGTDALGVERDQPGHETHLAFLKNDIIILEGLDLKNAEPGSHIMIVLPLKIKGAEGAPARAVLVDDLSELN
jgi:arylformamidase